jgi:TolA-binding protein
VKFLPIPRTILPIIVLPFLASFAHAAVVNRDVAQVPAKPDPRTRWHAVPSPGSPEPDSITQTRLPDAGPRFDRSGADAAMTLFEQGVAAYEKSEIPAAVSRFEAFLREHPQHEAAAAARAFLAESILSSPSEQPKRIDVITAYRTMSRDAPTSGNGKRAAWRIGDLYRELGWYQEAELAYQQALGRAEADSYDRSRALVGLGFTLLGMKRWSDAEKTLELARRQAIDPHLLAHASIGRAHALYRQGRIAEVDQLYAAAYGRWRPVFRREPYALIRYAHTSLSLNHTQVARRLLLEFYNLFPSSREAPETLLAVADSFQAAEQSDEAKLFYAVVAARYPASDAATIAQVRLIGAPAQQDGSAEWHDLPRRLVESLVLGLPLGALNPSNPESWLEEVAGKHSHSVIASEALFRLGDLKRQAGENDEAVQLYGRVTARGGRIDGDPWPDTAGARLVSLLRPSLQAATQAKDDLKTVTMFHRHGPSADRLYASDPLLCAVADAHARLGFAIEAARLYQTIIRHQRSDDTLEAALIGLGMSYLDQQDPQAAQRVFERYRLQFPLGRYAEQAFSHVLTAMAQQGHHATVVRVGRRWLRNRPGAEGRKEVLAKMGAALVQLQRPAEALAVWEEAYKLGGLDTPEALAAYGDLLSTAGRHEQAVALYNKSLASNPSSEFSAWIQMQIARALREARRPEQARAVLASISDDQALFRRVATVLGRDLPTASRAASKGKRHRP